VINDNINVNCTVGYNYTVVNVEKQNKVYVDLYSVPRQTLLMHSDMDHTVLPSNNIVSAFTPSRPLAGTHYAYPRTDGQAELTWVVG